MKIDTRARRASRVAVLAAAAAAVAVAAVAVTGAWAGSGSDGERGSDRPSPTPTSGESAPPPAVVDWFDDEAVVVFDGGWSVRSVEGDAPMLQVDRNGAVAGMIEALALPVDSLDGGADLHAMVERYYADIAEDRANGCGYEIETAPVRDATVGGQGGVTYQFSGPAGATPSERVISYATVLGDQVFLIVASAHDAGGCIGVDEDVVFTTDGLAEFAPLLERIVADTPLPTGFFGA